MLNLHLVALREEVRANHPHTHGRFSQTEECNQHTKERVSRIEKRGKEWIEGAA
jgi:hypothetical protein